jgi:hypothetical protein
VVSAALQAWAAQSAGSVQGGARAADLASQLGLQTGSQTQFVGASALTLVAALEAARSASSAWAGSGTFGVGADLGAGSLAAFLSTAELDMWADLVAAAAVGTDPLQAALVRWSREQVVPARIVGEWMAGIRRH